MGRVEEYLLKGLRKHPLHLTLVDPEKTRGEKAGRLCREAERAGTSAIMVGGSTVCSTTLVDETVKSIKKAVDLPVILFPNNLSGISRYADAIFFMSLLNSSNPYFLIDVQALGAPLVKEYGLEVLPMGYLILGSGGTAGFVGQARYLPPEKAELAAAYCLAAEYLGMHFVYLEAGSGAPAPVPTQTISTVRKWVRLPLIVGGGIKKGEDAERVARAGADLIVTGTVVEEGGAERIREIVEALRRVDRGKGS
ncbi:MAG: geranylgeranylglyceryl/heptaprenylglyceryl phosphate synthase [Candidatus Hadarchaeales archaeon]